MGKQACIILDVSLSRGGPEAICESLYSVMKTQKMDAGGMLNRTLEVRTKVDWMMPLPIACPRTVTKIAKHYGKTHKAPVLKMSDRRTRFSAGTVVQRLKDSTDSLFD